MISILFGIIFWLIFIVIRSYHMIFFFCEYRQVDSSGYKCDAKVKADNSFFDTVKSYVRMVHAEDL